MARDMIGLRPGALRDFLAQHGLTQAIVAQGAGVSVATIRALSKPEQYKRSGVTKEVAKKIASCLGGMTGKDTWQVYALIWDYDPLLTALALVREARDVVADDDSGYLIDQLLEYLSSRTAQERGELDV